MQAGVEHFPPTSVEKIREERANQITHGLGLALSLVGSFVLIRSVLDRGGVWEIAGAVTYSATLVSLYAASTLSHSFSLPRPRHFFRTVDQVCIFLLIAGAFTPVSLTYLRDGWWPVILIAMWVLAVWGIAAKLFRHRLENVTVWFYVATAWMPILAAKPMIERLPEGANALAAAGALSYMIGVWFFLRDGQYKYFHAVWHICVIGGSACHFGVIYLCLTAV